MDSEPQTHSIPEQKGEWQSPPYYWNKPTVDPVIEPIAEPVATEPVPEPIVEPVATEPVPEPIVEPVATEPVPEPTKTPEKPVSPSKKPNPIVRYIRNKLISALVITAAVTGYMKYDQTKEQNRIDNALKENDEREDRNIVNLIDKVTRNPDFSAPISYRKLGEIIAGRQFTFSPSIKFEANFKNDEIHCHTDTNGYRSPQIQATPIYYQENNEGFNELFITLDGNEFTVIELINHDSWDHLDRVIESKIESTKKCETEKTEDTWVDCNRTAYIYRGTIDDEMKVTHLTKTQSFVNDAYDTNYDLKNPVIIHPGENIGRSSVTDSKVKESIENLLHFFQVAYLPKIENLSIEYKKEVEKHYAREALKKAEAEREANIKNTPPLKKDAREFTPSQEEIDLFVQAFNSSRTEWQHVKTKKGYEFEESKWIKDSDVQKIAQGFAQLAKRAGVPPQTLANRLKESLQGKILVYFPKGSGGSVDGNQISVKGKKYVNILFHELIHVVNNILWDDSTLVTSIYCEGVTELFEKTAFPKEPIGYIEESLLSAALGPTFYFESLRDPKKHLEAITTNETKRGELISQLNNPVMDKHIDDFAKRWGINNEKDLIELRAIFNYTEEIGKNDTSVNYEKNLNKKIRKLRQILRRNGIGWTDFLTKITPPGTNFMQEWSNY